MELKFMEMCACQRQGAMTRLNGKIAQAAQTLNDCAMRRLAKSKKKIDSIFI